MYVTEGFYIYPLRSFTLSVTLNYKYSDLSGRHSYLDGSWVEASEAGFWCEGGV